MKLMYINYFLITTTHIFEKNINQHIKQKLQGIKDNS